LSSTMNEPWGNVARGGRWETGAVSVPRTRLSVAAKFVYATFTTHVDHQSWAHTALAKVEAGYLVHHDCQRASRYRCADGFARRESTLKTGLLTRGKATKFMPLMSAAPEPRTFSSNGHCNADQTLCPVAAGWSLTALTEGVL
jgi:hypothetical protein